MLSPLFVAAGGNTTFGFAIIVANVLFFVVVVEDVAVDHVLSRLLRGVLVLLGRRVRLRLVEDIAIEANCDPSVRTTLTVLVVELPRFEPGIWFPVLWECRNKCLLGPIH